MSRIGKQPIDIPSGVDIKIDGARVTVKGPRGELSQAFNAEMKLSMEGSVFTVDRPNEEGFYRGLHGLTRTLIANMIEGVTKGYEKNLDIVGVGYRAAMQGKNIELQVGYSHPVLVPVPDGIEFEVPAPTKIIVRGNDKAAVGEIAAKIRKVRKPEPYKGKGIRYEGEHVRKKAGKAAKAAG